MEPVEEDDGMDLKLPPMRHLPDHVMAPAGQHIAPPPKKKTAPPPAVGVAPLITYIALSLTYTAVTDCFVTCNMLYYAPTAPP